MVNRKTPQHARNYQDDALASGETNDSFYTENNSPSKRPRIDGDEDAYPSPGSETPTESDLERLGRGVKELIKTINKLELVGIEEIGLRLPRIVAVGDQSAGKSSLIEAISNIRVPRSNNTCTRCPIHITLEGSDSEEWICEVSLVKKYDYYSRNRHGWQQKDTPETTPFSTVRDKKQLGPVIQAAQLAILNPSKNPLTFVTCDPANESIEVEFSKNVVNLLIRGPQLPNLSFYDLPGIINQVENSRDAHLIPMVKELVVEHIRSPEAIVLLACSMESDIANCNAARVVREAGADSRCLCVLTKPDRYPQSEPYDHWKAILEGKKFPFRHGYHVVKNLGQNDLERYDHEEARKLETDFFRKSTPWHTPGFQKLSSLFGISNLQTKLSDLLASHIKKSLPTIRGQIDEQLEEVEEDLSRLPEPPLENPTWVVIKMLQQFYTRFEACIHGEDPGLKQEWEVIIERFANELTMRKPGINVQSQNEADRKRDARAIPINVDAEDQDEPQTPTTGSRSRRAPVAPPSGGSGTSTSTLYPAPRATVTPSAGAPLHGKKTFTLDEVRERLDQRAASFIGRFEHPKAVEAMIQESQKYWKSPLEDFSYETKRLLEDRVEILIQEIIQDRRDTELGRVLPECAQDYLRSAFECLDGAFARDLRSELIRPMIHTSFNRKMLQVKESEELSTIKLARDRLRQDLYLDENEPLSGKVTSGLERDKKRAQVDKLLEQDPYHHEITVMAKVRAYYLMACHRLVDTTARTVFIDLFEPAKDRLHKHLCEHLGVYGENALIKCQRLLADDPDREAERQRLKVQRDKLVEAKRQLYTIA